MSNEYEPPNWNWNLDPADQALAIHARRNPLDAVWLQRMRNALANEDHEYRMARDADALAEVRERTRQFALVTQELDVLVVADRAAEEILRQAEYAEMREREQSDLGRKRAADEIDERRAARQNDIAQKLARALEDAVANRGDASEAEAMFALAAAYGMNALLEIEELEQRVAELERK